MQEGSSSGPHDSITINGITLIEYLSLCFILSLDHLPIRQTLLSRVFPHVRLHISHFSLIDKQINQTDPVVNKALDVPFTPLGKSVILNRWSQYLYCQHCGLRFSLSSRWESPKNDIRADFKTYQNGQMSCQPGPGAEPYLSCCFCSLVS